MASGPFPSDAGRLLERAREQAIDQLGRQRRELVALVAHGRQRRPRMAIDQGQPRAGRRGQQPGDRGSQLWVASIAGLESNNRGGQIVGGRIGAEHLHVPRARRAMADADFKRPIEAVRAAQHEDLADGGVAREPPAHQAAGLLPPDDRLGASLRVTREANEAHAVGAPARHAIQAGGAGPGMLAVAVAKAFAGLGRNVIAGQVKTVVPQMVELVAAGKIGLVVVDHARIAGVLGQRHQSPEALRALPGSERFRVSSFLATGQAAMQKHPGDRRGRHRQGQVERPARQVLAARVHSSTSRMGTCFAGWAATW